MHLQLDQAHQHKLRHSRNQMYKVSFTSPSTCCNDLVFAFFAQKQIKLTSGWESVMAAGDYAAGKVSGFNACVVASAL
eukprot:623769-Amphidinium_carterae.1